jgi:hypothetical protein
MLRRTLGKTSFVLGATVSIMYSIEAMVHMRRRLAETEQVNSASEYVLVRLARGDYMNLDGPNTMINDFKFYKIITQPDSKN